MAITTDYLTGFEPGVINTSGGNTDTPKALTGASALATIISSGQRTGNYAVQVAPTGAAAGNIRWFNLQTGSTRRAWRFAVKITVLPSSGSTIIFAAHLSTTFRVGVRVDNTGLIQASLDGTNWYGSTTLTNPTTDWQIIDVNLDYSSATNALNWRVNEVGQTGTTFGAATTAPSVWTLGTTATTGAAATMLYDDVITGLATSATDFYGNGEVLGLVAGSDGTHSFTANDFSTGDAGTLRASSYTSFYNEVNDLPWTTARNTTRSITQRVIRTTGYTEIAPVAADSSKPTANAVLARLSYSSAGTQANTAGCIILNSAAASTTIFGASGALADYSESSNFTRGAFPTTPGAGWTHTEISALRFRFGYAGDITPVPTAQSLMLEVDYPVSSGPTTHNASASVVGGGVVAATAYRSITRTAAVAGTGAVAATAYRTITRTAAVAGTGVVAATAVREKDATASVAGGGAIAATAVRKAVVSAAVSGTGAVAATALRKAQPTAAVAGTGALAATAVREKDATASTAGTGAIAATAYRSITRTAAVSGTGTIAATATTTSGGATHNASASVAGAGSVVATATRERDATASVAGTGTVATTAYRTVARSAAVAGTGAIAATAVRERNATATVPGTGTVAATAYRKIARAAAVAGSGAVTATATRERNASAAVAGVGTIAATATRKIYATAAVAGGGTIYAEAEIPGSGVKDASADVAGSGQVVGTATRERNASAAIAGAGAIASSATRKAMPTVVIVGTGTVSATGARTAQAIIALAGAGTVSVAEATSVAYALAAIAGTGTIEAVGSVGGWPGTTDEPWIVSDEEFWPQATDDEWTPISDLQWAASSDTSWQ